MCHNNVRRWVQMPNRAYPPEGLRRSYRGSRSVSDLRGSAGAFTVIEILIVVVILAIAAMTALPMLSSAASVQVRSAANLCRNPFFPGMAAAGYNYHGGLRVLFQITQKTPGHGRVPDQLSFTKSSKI